MLNPRLLILLLTLRLTLLLTLFFTAAALKREQDALGKKLKTVEAAMKAVEKEMDDFQKEKQGALNQIDVALTLSLHQVTFMTCRRSRQNVVGARPS